MSKPASKDNNKESVKSIPSCNLAQVAKINEIIRCVNDTLETTDKKLKEMSSICMGKKCNEQ
jgi:hypothetical protein